MIPRTGHATGGTGRETRPGLREPRAPRGRRGFTLVELLLAVSLLLLLVSAMVFNFSTLRQGAELSEGATQLEALFRYASAQAAATGRQVRITFEENVGDGLVVPLGNLRVVWEPDPLGGPGLWENLPEAAGYVRSLTDLISIEEVRSLDAAPGGEGDAPAAGETLLVNFPPVTFYPDGSCDSAEVVLASRDADDTRRMVVRLSGVTGGIERRLLEEPSLASGEESAALAPGERPVGAENLVPNP